MKVFSGEKGKMANVMFKCNKVPVYASDFEFRIEVNEH